MGHKLTTPPKPSHQENLRLKNHFYLPGWQFDTLIGNKCIELSKHMIDWDGGPEYAIVYGLKAIYTDTQKECIATIFVHYGNRVYQCNDLEAAVGLLTLLKKSHDYDKYEDELWEHKNENQTPTKTKIKKLKATINKEICSFLISCCLFLFCLIRQCQYPMQTQHAGAAYSDLFFLT